MTDNRLAAQQPWMLNQRSLMSAGLPWLLVAALGMAAFYWTGLASLVNAWARPEYSHGYLIPLVAAFLFVRQSRSLAPGGAGEESIAGLLVVAAGLTVGLFGNLVQIPDVITYGFLVCLAGFVLILAGTRDGIRFWAPWLYLAFMLPLPQFVYLSLSVRLQLISSEIGVAIVSLFGIPVLLEGNVIDLGHYKLQVAEACNGLRYLFPLMSFGFLFAVLYRGPLWHRAIIFLSAIPITILMNSVRIGVIGYLVDRFGTEQAEGFLHFFEGWVIFAVCVAILSLLAFLLSRFARAHPLDGPMLDIETRGIGEQLARLRSVKASRSLTVASMLVVLAALAWHFAPAQTKVKPPRAPLSQMSMETGDWQGKPTILDPSIERVLGADDYFMGDFTSRAAALPVNFFIAYYESLTSGSGLHSPEVCLPTGGWEVSRWQRHALSLPGGQGSFAVNRAVIQKGLDRALVYYWFEQRGRQLAGDYAVKAYTIWDSLARGRSDGALVRVITPIGRSEREAAADARLVRFLTSAVQLLPRYVPH
jgi:exosortase D (VPLPA-CTERM-specific)